MAARATMSDLIGEVRALIQDATATYTLDDTTVQGVLDRHSQRIIRAKLEPLAPDHSTGLVAWHAALTTSWEDRGDLALYDADGTEHTATESDLMRGLWKVDPTSETLYLSDAWTYDVYAAAAECCSLLIAAIKDEYTFSTDEGNFSRSDRVNTLEKLGEQYRATRRLYSLPTGE